MAALACYGREIKAEQLSITIDQGWTFDEALAV